MERGGQQTPRVRDRVFIDNLLVRIHFIIAMMRWSGLAPWEFEFSFPGSLTSTRSELFGTFQDPGKPLQSKGTFTLQGKWLF